MVVEVSWSGERSATTTGHNFRQCLNAVVYRDHVIRSNVILIFAAHHQLQVFKQDNTRSHTSRMSMVRKSPGDVGVVMTAYLSGHDHLVSGHDQ